MQKYRYIKAAIIALSMAFIMVGPSMLSAETLRVLRGDITAAISVSIGKTVLVESSTAYTEVGVVSIANPEIADISILSPRLVAITGIRSGRTTFIARYRPSPLTNVDLPSPLTSVEILVAPNIPKFDETNPVRLPDMPPAEIIPVLDGVASDAITVPSGGAVGVGIDVPYVELGIGNLDIADAVPLTDSMIYLLGKDVGRTTLTLLRNDGQPATIIQVHVSPNMEGVE